MFGFGPIFTSLIFLLIALYFPLRHFYTRGVALLASFGVCVAIFLLLLVLPRAVVAYAFVFITSGVLLAFIYEVWLRARG